MNVTINPFSVDGLKRLSDASPNVFEFEINNNTAQTVNDISWSCDMGDTTTVDSTQNITLENTTFVYVQYNYTSSGTYTVNCSATNTTVTDYEDITVIVG